jgi:hypothetical protein
VLVLNPFGSPPAARDSAELAMTEKALIVGASAAIDTTLLEKVFSLASHLAAVETPAKVIAALSAAIEHGTSLQLLGAARVPSNPHSWAANVGQTVFCSGRQRY